MAGRWVNFLSLEPLDAAGQPIVAAPKSSYEVQRQMQEWFEKGYRNVSLQRAIKENKGTRAAVGCPPAATATRHPPSPLSTSRRRSHPLPAHC